MRIPASFATIARVGSLWAAVSVGAACTHAGGRLMVDVPKLLPYQPPDADEIAGVDPDAEEPAAPGAGAAQNPHKEDEHVRHHWLYRRPAGDADLDWWVEEARVPRVRLGWSFGAGSVGDDGRWEGARGALPGQAECARGAAGEGARAWDGGDGAYAVGDARAPVG